MLRIVALLCGVGMFAAVSMPAQPVSAQVRCFGYESGYGFGTGLRTGSRYFQPSTSSHDRIPYFALHPPVYYNGIVARPYGISPFAAPPGIRPIEMEGKPVAKPVMIENPHFNGEEPSTPPPVEGETTKATPAEQPTVQFVVNPYFESNQRLAASRKR